MTAARVRTDPRLAGLGPDLVAPRPFDEAKFLRRLREDDPTRTLGDALLDQHVVAGIGNFWKSEGCWLAQVDPWRRLAGVSDEEALAVVLGIRPLMQRSAEHGLQSAFRDDLREGGGAMSPLRRSGAHPGARPGRRQPHHVLVPRLPALTAGAGVTDASAGRRPETCL